ncbi:MAG TPA: RodZ domain-containing protein [Acidimicrobiales bacterium]|nr:RodZ domain-containing protein [Acidimicrobiales bacterium]
MGSSVAIDLGTVNTLVYAPNRGLVIEQPSVVALQGEPRRVLAVGSSADRLYGCAPAGVEVVKPLRDGVVSDLDACALMLKAFVRQAFPYRRLRSLRTLVCVPDGATDIERRALVEATEFGNPRLRVTMIDEAVAAALGSGADKDPDRPVLVVDIGGGSTEIALVAGSETIRSASIRVAGNAMDAAIMRAVRAECGLLIGEGTAERLKIAIGLAGTDDPVTISGIGAGRSGTLRRAEVTPKLIAGALEPSVKAIVSTLAGLLEGIPPDLAEDILDGGIRLAGGGALLLGLPEEISEHAGCRSEVVPDPLRCAIRGLGRALEPAPRAARQRYAARYPQRSHAGVIEALAQPPMASTQAEPRHAEPTPAPTDSSRRPRAYSRPAAVLAVATAVAALALGLALHSAHDPGRGRHPPVAAPSSRSPTPVHQASPPTTTPPHPSVVAASVGSYSSTYTSNLTPMNLSLAASQRCWIELRSGSASGPIIYQAVIPAGDRHAFDDLPGLWIRLGYPSGITMRVNGVPIALPGSGPFDVTVESDASAST